MRYTIVNRFHGTDAEITIRDNIVAKSGENSIEVSLFDMVIKRIENMDEDGFTDEDDEGGWC